jgi:methyl-accepting chemotaxis protein
MKMDNNAASRGKNNDQPCAAGRSTAPFLFAVIAGLSIFILCGCGQRARRVFRGKKTPQATRISKQELHEELDKFEEAAGAKYKQLAGKLDQLVPDLKTRRINLIMRTRLGQAFRTMLEQDDPVVAFIETWGLCVRLRYYLQEGDGLGLYGEYQSLAIDMWEEIEARIEQIGREFLDDDTFAETRHSIHQFARANPIRGTFGNIVVYATEVRPGQPGYFEKVVGIPMAPFSAMKGVDRTASAIYGVQGSVERFSDIVEELPESAQWQLLLLLMEMEETEVVKSLLSSMSKFSDSSVRLADTAEKWPETIREQASLLVDEIDTKQANLQVTLDKAEKTAAAVGQALSKFEEATETMGRTANEVTEAAEVWESAAAATGQVIKEVSSMSSKRSDAPKTSITDYRDVAQQVTDAANEIRALTAELQELIDSEALPAHIEDVNNRVIGAVDRTALQARSLTDHITWRMAQVLLLVFALALAYRLITGRLFRRPP